MADFFNRIGRLQSFSAWLTHSPEWHPLTPINCKQLVSTNANDWSVAMQLGGQVRCNYAMDGRSVANNVSQRKWNVTRLRNVISRNAVLTFQVAQVWVSRKAVNRWTLGQETIPFASWVLLYQRAGLGFSEY